MTEISFEFYPPKTSQGKERLIENATRLKAAKPSFFSVTNGAGGSTRAGTLDAITALNRSTGITSIPHLSAIGNPFDELSETIQQYQELNIKRLVALRGDLPSGMGRAGQLIYACDLVKLIREKTGEHFHISVAAYPEVHPQSDHALMDLKYFKQKVDAGANSAITQYFYNADAYLYFRDLCLKHGITIPIIPGIMPITNFSKLLRFSNICGAEIPRWIIKRLQSYGDDIVAIKEFGLEVTYRLCEKLLAAGVPGLHFYTLNNAEASLKICEFLDL